MCDRVCVMQSILLFHYRHFTYILYGCKCNLDFIVSTLDFSYVNGVSFVSCLSIDDGISRSSDEYVLGLLQSNS